MPLEFDAEVDLLHDAAVESDAAIEFLDPVDAFPHLTIDALERVHQSLQAHLAKHALPDRLTCLAELFDEFTSYPTSKECLDCDDLLKACCIQDLLQPSSGLFFKEDFGEADLELAT